ncbi:hypothetical protein [Roseateles oligotrophus]|uniref:Uncharacterized protein n=1 Tax=Roseateles oligotrophus TaxID=1769250 RepID=A0ABT2YCB6_9BURK|nr:hypothetical protein [Roseateles oligotrophus]MCV2367682.1 hypothetical protein [Roseateles oligotrophus]
MLDIFPRAEALVGGMRLDCVRKDVTYETLASVDFRETVRKAFPFEAWNKPLAEFTAAQAAQAVQRR